MSKPRAIIIEGPDGMGKSTLAGQLAYALGMQTAVCGPAPKTFKQISMWVDAHENAVRTGGVVLDRVTVFSHQVYDRLFGTNEHADYLRKRARDMLDLCPIVVLCDSSSVKHAPKEYDDPERDAMILTNMTALRKAYKNLFDELQVIPIIYDWTAQNAFANLLEKINE